MRIGRQYTCRHIMNRESGACRDTYMIRMAHRPVINTVERWVVIILLGALSALWLDGQGLLCPQVQWPLAQAASPAAGISRAAVYYPNCASARAAGAAPLTVVEPGYREGLDADRDGIACEPYFR